MKRSELETINQYLQAEIERGLNWPGLDSAVRAVKALAGDHYVEAYRSTLEALLASDAWVDFAKGIEAAAKARAQHLELAARFDDRDPNEGEPDCEVDDPLLVATGLLDARLRGRDLEQSLWEARVRAFLGVL